MEQENPTKRFPVVCVGGSAGGLDAYTRLLAHVPANTGAAFVIVNHLRTVATLLHEILPRYTTMPVDLITEKLMIQPNRVFIIPEKRDSGYDGDGAAALQGIKEVGGITIAQKLDTARQPDMPESAIASGYVDFVLSPEDIARKIVGIARAA